MIIALKIVCALFPNTSLLNIKLNETTVKVAASLSPLYFFLSSQMDELHSALTFAGERVLGSNPQHLKISQESKI